MTSHFPNKKTAAMFYYCVFTDSLLLPYCFDHLLYCSCRRIMTCGYLHSGKHLDLQNKTPTCPAQCCGWSYDKNLAEEVYHSAADAVCILHEFEVSKPFSVFLGSIHVRSVTTFASLLCKVHFVSCPCLQLQQI